MSVVAVQAELRARIKDALAAAPFDWLLVAQPENVAYVSGYRSVAWSTRNEPTMMAALGPDGNLQLAGPAADTAAVVEDAIVPADHYVPYGSFFFESANGNPLPNDTASQATLAEASRELLDRIETTSVLGLDAAAAATLDGGRTSESVDASDWLLDLRACKTPAEVALLERAATITEDAIAAAAATIKPGMNERAIANGVAAHIGDAGGAIGLLVVTSGERSALADTHPTDRTVARGELIRFDIGCIVDGYWSDLGRTFVMGSASEKQQRRYEAIRTGLQAQLDSARPGMPASELFDLAVETVEARGLTPYRRHHCGHAIGREMYEKPIVAPGSKERLREGMCLCLETPFYELGWGGMIVEDMAVVTNSGIRRLTQVASALPSL